MQDVSEERGDLVNLPALGGFGPPRDSNDSIAPLCGFCRSIVAHVCLPVALNNSNRLPALCMDGR